MYDAIIIGSGMGGLTAAARLARNGAKVCVLEQHTVPGGSASYFERGGYRFDVGASLLYGLGEDGSTNFITQALREVGQTVESVRDPIQIHYHLPDGLEIRTHYDREAFFAELFAHFPHERKGVRAFYDAVSEAFAVMSRVPLIALDDVAGLVRGMTRAPLDAMRMARSALTNLGDIARTHIRDPRLLRFIDIEVFCWALVGARETPLVNGALVFGDRHAGGVRYPIGGVSVLAEKLAAGVAQRGGEMRYRSRVVSGVLERGRLRGVKLATGEEILARAVISNATLWDTYGRLVADHPLAGVALRENALRYAPADSFVSFFGGVAVERVPPGAAVHHIVVDDWADYDQPRGMLFVSLPSIHDPSIAPAGFHNVHAFMVDRYEAWRDRTRLDDDAGRQRRTPEYRAAKDAATADMLARLERVIPDARRVVEPISIGTPLTNERYLARTRGTYGPLLRRGADVLLKPQSGTLIPGLFCAGDSCFPGQGVPAVVMSGFGCADRALRALA
jgi:prolycopene isomerase